MPPACQEYQQRRLPARAFCRSVRKYGATRRGNRGNRCRPALRRHRALHEDAFRSTPQCHRRQGKEGAPAVPPAAQRLCPPGRSPTRCGVAEYARRTQTVTVPPRQPAMQRSSPALQQERTLRPAAQANRTAQKGCASRDNEERAVVYVQLDCRAIRLPAIVEPARSVSGADIRHASHGGFL